MLTWGGGRKKEKERITALEQALEALKTGNKLIRTEWEDTLDRMNRIMGRLNARIRRSESKEEAPESDAGLSAELEGGLHKTGTHAVLAEMRSRSGILRR